MENATLPQTLIAAQDGERGRSGERALRSAEPDDEWAAPAEWGDAPEADPNPIPARIRAREREPAREPAFDARQLIERKRRAAAELQGAREPRGVDAGVYGGDERPRARGEAERPYKARRAL